MIIFRYMKVQSFHVALVVVIAIGLLQSIACNEGTETSIDGDITDGDIADGDISDGDYSEVDVSENYEEDLPDGDSDLTEDEAASELLTRLHADGTRIVNALGETVVLKGVNLGGWLFNETWITQVDYSLTSRLHALGEREGIGEAVDDLLAQGEPTWGGEGYLDALLPGLTEKVGSEKAEAFISLARGYLPTLYDDCDLPLRLKLSERFGDDARDELLDIFQGAWINESDIAWIAEQGFNVVRVPISYRNLVTGPDLAKPTELVWNELAWSRLVELVDWCETNRIYVVIDIQESPGGHNNYSGEALLYNDPELQALTVELWEEISSRFSDRDNVAAYSLLAEPMSAPDAETRDAMYDKLVKAIRARGDNHLLVIHDGFLGMNTLPDPADMDWSGVVYSTHIFEFSAQDLSDYEFVVEHFYDPIFSEAQERCGVPFYIGSFSTRKDEEWAYSAADLLLSWYNEREWSWSVWTYKKIDDPIEILLWEKSSSYGVIGRLDGEFTRPDAYDDDLDTLKARMAAYADLQISPNTSLLEVLQKAL